MARRRSKASSPPATPLPGLALHPAAMRVQGLLRERGRLAREAQKKNRQLEQLKQRLSQEAQEGTAKMVPLVERHRMLVAALATLFDELLAENRLSKRARAQVAQIRRSLEFQGVLAPIHGWLNDDSVDDEVDDPRESGGTRPQSARSNPRRDADREHATAAEVAGARQVGQEKRSLRDLFRNLARTIHPDKAQHEADRAQRTEVMKQVTRAYEDGDLARLVQLESEWQSQLVEASPGDPEARCRELELVNRELLDQVRRLTRELRDTKREAQDVFGGASPDELIATATQELDQIQAVAELLREFRDGRLTLAELKRVT